MRDLRAIIAGLGLAAMAVGGVTAVAAGGSPAGSAPSAGTAAATVRTAPVAVGRSAEAILVKAQAAAASTPGSLDPTFGNGGKVLIPGGGATDAILQPNGDIVVTGGFGAARFLPTGKLDTTFGNGGLASAGFVGGESRTGVALQSDGKIIWVGSQGNPSFPAGGTFAFAIARFNANGTLDTSFGTGGKILSSSLPGITTLGLDAAGNIFPLPTRAEFSPSGQADASVTPAAITASSHAGTRAFLPSGQFIQANGVTVAKHNDDIQVRRFNANGVHSGAKSESACHLDPAVGDILTAEHEWPTGGPRGGLLCADDPAPRAAVERKVVMLREGLPVSLRGAHGRPYRRSGSGVLVSHTQPGDHRRGRPGG